MTASTSLIQSSNSPARSFSSEDTENVRARNQLILAAGNFFFNSFSVTSRISGAARLLLHSRPMFLPARPDTLGARPCSGMGSASAQGLSTSYNASALLALISLPPCIVISVSGGNYERARYWSRVIPAAAGIQVMRRCLDSRVKPGNDNHDYFFTCQ